MWIKVSREKQLKEWAKKFGLSGYPEFCGIRHIHWRAGLSNLLFRCNSILYFNYLVRILSLSFYSNKDWFELQYCRHLISFSPLVPMNHCEPFFKISNQQRRVAFSTWNLARKTDSTWARFLSLNNTTANLLLCAYISAMVQCLSKSIKTLPDLREQTSRYRPSFHWTSFAPYSCV